MQHVKGSVENDYETMYFACSSGYNYRECKKYAKEYSKHIGEVHVKGIPYNFEDRQPDKEFYYEGVDEGLAAVKIVCYTEDEWSTYSPLYYEYYKDGKVDYKVHFDE